MPNDVHQNFIERLGMVFQFIIRSLLNTTFHYHHNHNHLLLFFYHIYIYIYIYVPTTICHLINVGFYCVNVMFELRFMHEKIVFLCTEYVFLYVWRNVRISRIYMVLYCDIFAAAIVPKKRKCSSIISFVMPCISKHVLSIRICV